MISRLQRVRGMYYGWWLAIIGGFIMIITSVPIFHAMTVWAVAMEAQFGWSRTQLGFALSLTRVEGSLSGPLAGYLTDRFGARVMVFTGLLILAGGFLLFGWVQNLWMFYLAFFIMSMGNGQAGWLPVMTLLNQWFIRNRTIAMAVAMTGMGVGALILVPVIAWAVNPDEELNRLGWRWTARIFSGVILISALLIPWLIRNRPQDYGLHPDGDQPNATGEGVAGRNETASPNSTIKQSEPEFTARQAIRTPVFWYITFGHGLASMVILAIFSHLGLLMVQDEGYSVQTTAWIVTVYTAVSLVFQMLSGYLGDRIPKNIALFIFTFIQASGIVVLAFASSLQGLYLFAILFGIGFGGRSPLTTSIRGEYFGRASFGKILGISTVPMNVLLLISSPMAGFMRDHSDNYHSAFITLAVLNFIGAALFLLARKPRLSSTAPQTQAARLA